MGVISFCDTVSATASLSLACFILVLLRQLSKLGSNVRLHNAYVSSDRHNDIDTGTDARCLKTTIMSLRLKLLSATK